MDYLNSTAPRVDRVEHFGAAINYEDRRRSRRLPLRSRALIGIPGNQVVRGHTIDISTEGLSVLVPIRLNVGQECRVFFTLMIEDQLIAVSGQGKIANCTCSVLDGFRIGMKFDIGDKVTRELIDKLLVDRLAK